MNEIVSKPTANRANSKEHPVAVNLPEVLKPRRVTHSYIQSLNASRERVFPLLCAVREMDWAPGWWPELVISSSGVMEKEAVFVTPTTSDTPETRVQTIWLVTIHDTQAYYLEIYKVTPGHVTSKLTIALTESENRTTNAEIAYTHTALSKSGAEWVAGYTEEIYIEEMEHWEMALNHYLKTGEMITTD